MNGLWAENSNVERSVDELMRILMYNEERSGRADAQFVKGARDERQGAQWAPNAKDGNEGDG